MAETKKYEKLSQRLYADLPKWEIGLWITCWTFGVSYSICNLFKISKGMTFFVLLLENIFKIQISDLGNFLHDEDFMEGYITNTKYDKSDFEWFTFNPFTNKTYITFVALHIIGTQILKKHSKVRKKVLDTGF